MSEEIQFVFYRAKHGNNVDKMINLASGRLGFSHSEILFPAWWQEPSRVYLDLYTRAISLNRVTEIPIFDSTRPWSFSSTIRDASMAPSLRMKKDGTRFKQIDFDPEKWVFRPVYASKNEVEIVGNHCLSILEAGYDFAGVGHRIPFFGIFFKQSVFDYFCTESGVEAFQQVEVFNHVSAYEATPNNMAWFLGVDNLRQKYPDWRG